jgi:nucleoside-diphosphate-sugar epimerase
MKSAIVVGASSMLGREITRQLINEGINVITAGRRSDNDIWVDLACDQLPKFSLPYKAEVLFHCASAFGGDSPEGLRENFRVNLGGCLQTLEIAREASANKIVYAGSAFSDPMFNFDPMGVYGFSKAEAERILEWGMYRIGGTFSSLRLPQLWDTEGLCCNHQPWFGRIVAYASRGLTLKMPSSGGGRNFMHISDAARLLIRAAWQDITGVHAVVYPTDIELAELARLAFGVFGRGGEVVIDPNKSPFRKVAFPREDGVFEQLGHQPEISLEKGLEMIRDAGTSERFGPMDVQ